MDAWVQTVIDVIRANAVWAGPILFLVTFGEAMAFIGLIVPGTTILVAAGGVIATGALDLWVILAWTIPAAILGDWVSFWLARHFKDRIPTWWPFNRHPEMLARGVAFFERHGGKSVFIGRFFGPVRATIPIAAGMLGMPNRSFWVANVLSALIWVPGLLLPGVLLGVAYRLGLTPDEHSAELIAVGAAAVIVLLVVVARRYRLARRSA
jgi:membrane protein DedA with SNARE-associated domain